MGRKTWQPGPCEQVLLGLARGEVDQRNLVACDPEELSRFARSHKVLFPLATLLEADPNTPPVWRLWAAQRVLSSQADQDQLTRGLASTVALLAEAGIASVVLKGSSLALGRPRDVGDADLLLSPGDIVPAIGILESHGYTYQGFDRNHRIRRREYRDWNRLLRWSNQFEFREPRTGLLVELHSAFFESGRVYPERLGAFQHDPEPFLRRAVAAGPYRWLSLEDRLLLLALHGGLKRSPAERSFVLRHVLDEAVLESAGPDRLVLLQRASDLGCGHHLYLLALVVREFRSSAFLDQLVEALEASLRPAVVRLVRLHARVLQGLHGYDGPRLALYRFLAPFVLHGTPGARLRSVLLVPLFVPPLHGLAKVYRLDPRTWWLPGLYLLEPVRLVGQAVAFFARRWRRRG